jgi:hypothetical protein
MLSHRTVLTVRRSTFTGNTSYSGGAINVNTYATFIVTDSEFYNNKAILNPADITNEGDGGAIIIWDSQTFEIARCIFDGNETTINAGGAILLWSTKAITGKTGTITDCVFTNNRAFVGGAVANIMAVGSARSETISTATEGYDLTISGSTFEGNEATDSGENTGGAIFTTNLKELTIGAGVVFTGNLAVDMFDGVVYTTDKDGDGENDDVTYAAKVDPGNPTLDDPLPPYTSAYNNADINYFRPAADFIGYYRNRNGADSVNYSNGEANPSVVNLIGKPEAFNKPGGYRFIGWSLDRDWADGSDPADLLAPGTEIAFTGNIDYYAIWQKMHLDATLNGSSTRDYTGNPLNPGATVTDKNTGATLTKGTDYTISYLDGSGNPITNIINVCGDHRHRRLCW